LIAILPAVLSKPPTMLNHFPPKGVSSGTKGISTNATHPQLPKHLQNQGPWCIHSKEGVVTLKIHQEFQVPSRGWIHIPPWEVRKIIIFKMPFWGDST